MICHHANYRSLEKVLKNCKQMENAIRGSNLTDVNAPCVKRSLGETTNKEKCSLPEHPELESSVRFGARVRIGRTLHHVYFSALRGCVNLRAERWAKVPFGQYLTTLRVQWYNCCN